MARNKLMDLNNHLFEQLERLNDEELSDDELQKEIKRSKSMTSVAKVIVDNAELMLQAQKHRDEYYFNEKNVPDVLKIGNDYGKDS